MKLPNIFVPEKSLDENIERLLNTKTGKTIKHREIKDAFSLLRLPEYIRGYRTDHKKDFDYQQEKYKKIQAYEWCLHFKNPVYHSLVEACKVDYFKRRSAKHNSAVIYALNFSSDSELDEIMDKISIVEWFIGYEGQVIQCLKKDNYVIALLINKELKDDLKLFEKFYIDNFGMVKL